MYRRHTQWHVCRGSDTIIIRSPPMLCVCVNEFKISKKTNERKQQSVVMRAPYFPIISTLPYIPFVKNDDAWWFYDDDEYAHAHNILLKCKLIELYNNFVACLRIQDFWAEWNVNQLINLEKSLEIAFMIRKWGNATGLAAGIRNDSLLCRKLICCWVLRKCHCKCVCVSETTSRLAVTHPLT